MANNINVHSTSRGMTRTTLLFFVLLLVAISTVTASEYTSYGGNAGLSRNIVVTRAVTPPQTIVYSTSGNHSEPIIADLTGNTFTTPQVYVSIGNTLHAIDGKTQTDFDTIQLGTPVATPTVCDIDNNGVYKRLVGIYNNGTANNLVAVGLGVTCLNDACTSTTKRFTVIATKELTGATFNQYNTKLGCGPMFAKQSDTRNYIAFVDNNKTLYMGGIPSYGASFSIPTYTFSEVQAELTHDANYTYLNGDVSRGSNNVIMTNAIDPDGYGTVAFTAGDKLFVVDASDCGYVPLFGSTCAVVHSADVKASVTTAGFVKSAAVLAAGNTINIHQAGTKIVVDVGAGEASVLAIATLTKNLFGLRTLNIDSTVLLPSSGNDPQYVAVSTTNDIDNNKAYYTITHSAALNAEDCGVVDMNTYGVSVISPCYANIHVPLGTVALGTSDLPKLYTGNFYGFGTDLLVTQAGTGKQEVRVLESRTNYTTFTNPFNITSGVTPAPVSAVADFTGDGRPDFVFTAPGMTYLYVTSIGGTTSASKYPFTPSVINSSFDAITNRDLITTKIVTNYSGSTVNYGLTCDITSTTIFLDSYVPIVATHPEIYNNLTLFTDAPGGSNVSTYLTANGLTFTVGAGATFFDFYRTTGTNTAGSMVYSLYGKTPDTPSFDIVLKDASFVLTDYLRIKKNSTSLSIFRINGGNETYLGTGSTTVVTPYGTFPADEFFLQVVYTPAHDAIRNTNYYTTQLLVNYNSVNTTAGDTSIFAGSTISNIELFTNANATFTIKQQGLRVDPSYNKPEIVSFSKNDAPTPVDTGSYIVFAGANGGNTFASQCSYPSAGTYIQRHYIGGNTTDYSNYKDLVVITSDFANAVTQAGIITGNLTAQGVPPAGANPITDFFDFLFGTSSAVRFFIWMGLTIVVMIGVISVVSSYGGGVSLIALMVGAVTFVAMIIGGFLIGMLPLWTMLMLGIVCAAIAGLTITKIFSPP